MKFSRYIILGTLTVLWALSSPLLRAATFQGNARVEITDTTGGLTWDPAKGALTVSCWFKRSIPSDFTLSEDMAILVNRRSGTATDAHAYALYLSATPGNIEFSSRGSATEPPKKIIEHPYLDRWYHIAIVRSGGNLIAYVDGRETLNEPTNVGDSKSNDGVSVGSWSSAKYLRGEVQEVTIYQVALSQEDITQNLYQDLAIGTLEEREPSGYFKLGYSATASDNLKKSKFSGDFWTGYYRETE